MNHTPCREVIAHCRRVIAVLLVCLASSSCAKRPAPLPGGYFLFRASGSEIYLNEPKYNGSVPGLGRTLEAIGHHQNFIFGRSSAGPGAVEGFFLLDTKDGSITTGLKEADWLTLTSAAGIPNPPPLVNPELQTPMKR
jgi:hypothetical protein